MNTDSLTSIPQASQDAANANPTISGQISALQGGGPTPVIGPGSPDPTLNAPPVSQTQDASQINGQISGGSTGVIFPQAPGAPTKGVSDNTSVPNPIPSAADIISQGTNQTPAEATNQTLLQKVASLIGQKQGQTQLTNTAEAAAGVPALTKTVNDLNTQLEGLNNQATDLQNQAAAGGAIDNQEQQNVLGRGVTAAGLAPQTAGDLRKNQIQQSAIASQALTLKSVIYGAQGQLTLAKDAADKAATAQYEQQQIAIDYQNALIAANLPSMTKQEKAQADLVTQNLADRQRQLDQAKDDKKTIIAMATAVMQAYPNDPAAHYAAQQALAESNKEQPSLQAAIGLVGKYQDLDTQLKVAQIAQSRAAAAKDNAAAAASTGPALAQTNTRQTTSGITYVDGTNLTGKDAQNAQAYAAANHIPYLDKTSADLQNNVETARQNMNNISSSLNGVLAKSGLDVYTKLGNVISATTQTGSNSDALASFAAYRSAAIQALRAMAGAKGLRINQAEIMQSVNNDIPKITDTVGVAQAKIKIVNSLLDSQEKGTFGSNYYAPTSGGETGTLPDGTKVTQNADGSITDAQGNKYDTNGNKLR